MGFIFGDLSLIKELKRKLNFILCKPNLNAHGLTNRQRRFFPGRFRRRLRKEGKKYQLYRDGETLPKVQEVKSNDNKSASEQGDDRVDDWLSDAFSNGLGNIQDPPKDSEVPFSDDESRRGFTNPVSSPGNISSDKEIDQTSLNCNTFVGYLDQVQIQSTFDLLDSLIEQLQEFKYCKISRLNNDGFFAFEFPAKDQEILVLERGQLFIDNKPLILKRWSPSIDLVPTSFLSAIPIWVRFKNLNWAYWNQVCLSKISSIIGVPLFMDRSTATMTRLDYARVCIEVNTDILRLPDTVHMLRNGKIIPVPVEYEWKPLQCVICLSIYHDSGNLRWLSVGEFVLPGEVAVAAAG
ncbi:hypothetical protein Leryth_014205 [Lithospermum erythrorhizon]|nr:hypothetical protein Leryth_014205 [Lithospermum erythrorhizon]